MKTCRISGFTLIELMVTVMIIGILAAVALPSYQNYIVKGSRAAAQTELLDLASRQEKIYLNSNAYTANVTTAYNGTSAGGLNVSTGQTTDGKYDISITTNGQTYTITATPVAGKSQASDGSISISENGQKLWNGTAW